MPEFCCHICGGPHSSLDHSATMGTSTQATKPAAWAVRAALQIQAQFFPHTRIPGEVRKELADIIERESPGGKMAEALKQIVDTIPSNPKLPLVVEIKELAERVLREIDLER